MKKSRIIAIGAGLSLGLVAWNIQANPSEAIAAQQASNKPTPTYFYDKKTGSGTMSISEIAPFLEKPLFCKDSTGKLRQIIQFTLVYAERGIYADEAGKPFIDVYYLSADSENGIVPEQNRKLLLERMKSGDTLKIIAPLSFYNFKDENTAFYADDISVIIK